LSTYLDRLEQIILGNDILKILKTFSLPLTNDQLRDFLHREMGWQNLKMKDIIDIVLLILRHGLVVYNGNKTLQLTVQGKSFVNSGKVLTNDYWESGVMEM